MVSAIEQRHSILENEALTRQSGHPESEQSESDVDADADADTDADADAYTGTLRIGRHIFLTPFLCCSRRR